MLRAVKAYLEVRLQRIHVTRGERPVLRAIDWHIRPGQHWVLVGANGAGKTQLLKLIAGAVWPVPEQRPLRRYRWGTQVRSTPYEAQDEIAYVGPERQDRYERYGWNHTVEQIIGTGIHRTDIPLQALSSADQRTVGALARRLDITALLSRRFLTLSYGERRLVLLARALASRPRLLLMDELLNGLDAARHANALRFLGGHAPVTTAVGPVGASGRGCARQCHSRADPGAGTHRLPRSARPGAARPLVCARGGSAPCRGSASRSGDVLGGRRPARRHTAHAGPSQQRERLPG